MNTVARTPSSRAAHPTACPWLPALAATTPAARSASLRSESMLTAPRILKAPVRWRFSALSQTPRPLRRDRVAELKTGVWRTRLSTRARAASMSARFGAVLVANVEHLLEDLPYGGQRVERSCLHLVEEPAQVGVVAHRLFEVPPGAGRGQ